MGQLSNIKLSDFRRFLEFMGLKSIRNKGGHEIWSRGDLLRPIVLQSHIDPVPEFIIKTNLKTIGVKADVLLSFLKK